MRKNFFLLAAIAGIALVSGCAAPRQAATTGGAYKVTAFKPHNPSAVSVKVSESTQNIYVKEGDRLLMAVQGCVGANGTTPKGNFRIQAKIKQKRSYSYGFTSDGRPAEAKRGDNVAVGYPMAYWCEFAPAYGFHEGFVHPVPRTHGCIRLHKEAAARFFQLVQIGTPVNIAASQPEDSQYGQFVRKLDQRKDPDPPTNLLMSSTWFQDPPGQLLLEQ